MEEKKTKKSNVVEDITFDTQEIEKPLEAVEIPTERKAKRKTVATVAEDEAEAPEFINCLRNERVIVRYINKPSSITDPRHVLFGRMHENAKKTFVVPRLSSGAFVNVLTNDEKNYLEHIMGLEKNAMSIYRKENNFWDDSLDNSLASVTLTKQDNIFDLSVPEDYIRVKILLANKNFIAPSYEDYMDMKKASYLYYITSEKEESQKALNMVGNKSSAYIELGKIVNDIPKMRMLLELIVGRPTSPNSKKEYLQVELSKCIEGNAKEFLRILKDPLLDTKAFIKQCHEAGIISKRGDWYYIKADNSPLCEMNEEPTLNVAARYLNHPKHQDLLFSLQAKMK